MSANFKVLIAGGSIAGLAQALMLEKAGFDFLVLEAYKEIAPQVGASIGLLPNGLRVLDQLGCYEDLMAAAEYPVEKVYFRRSTGKTFWTMEDYSTKSIKRHGYPTIFLDRRMVIEVLYNHINEKSKILTNKKVESVEQTDSGVKVTTKDGSVFFGDMIVGADGIHSTVRDEMWKTARESEPGWFSDIKNNEPPAVYACMFGISQDVPGIENGTLHSVFNKHFSYLLPSGPQGRTYFFLVWNMGETYYGRDAPKFTAEDEAKLVEKHWNDQITPELRFSDIYSRKTTSVCTALAEHTFEKWHFGRFITIGDAAHKFEPISGQGGNSAVETAAALTNSLVDALSQSKSGRLSTSELGAVFKSVQSLRFSRVDRLIAESHARQRLEAMESPLLRAIGYFVVPYMTDEKVYGRWASGYCSGVSLKALPLPPRSKVVPYDDEVENSPRQENGSSLMAFALPFVCVVLGSTVLLNNRAHGMWSTLREVAFGGALQGMGIRSPLQ